MNTQKRIERRKSAAIRLTTQLGLGTKPARQPYPLRDSSKEYRTLVRREPLTDADIKRIKKELESLNN
jgi:hypothetical protein